MYVCEPKNFNILFMKSPQECQNINEIRECIDTIDSQIIELLAKRFDYVKSIVPFKAKTTDAIIAKERKEQVIKSRRALAEKYELDPDIIEQMYTLLINYFIEQEIKLINAKNV